MAQLVPVKECDFLDNDPQLRGQNYVCLSFLSPEEVIQQKEHYYFEKFISSFTDEMKELFDGLTSRYPKDADNLRMLKERYSYLFTPNTIGDEFNYFVSNHSDELQKAFDEKNDFKTSIRGIKVRGVFDTIREAQVRSEVLKKLDGKFNVYVAEVGCWCPWSPNPEDIQDQEFAETHLNTMMKHYKENQTKKDIFYEERKRELQFMKVKKDMETDTWSENKLNSGEASTSSAHNIVFESSLVPDLEADEVVVSDNVEEVVAEVLEESDDEVEEVDAQQADVVEETADA